MGRKSAAKTHSQPSSATPPPEEPKPSLSLLPIVAVIAVAGVIGVFAYLRSAGPQPDPSGPTAAQSASPAVVDPPAAAALGPHPQENLPPLPFSPAPPARPAEVVRAVYKFAAEHPEVLSYVPCYCGCEQSGHQGNEDCFVAARDGKGDVTEWDAHGMT